MSQSAAARIPDPERESSTSGDVVTLAESVAAKAHRFNNALTTIIGLVDWHLDVENHPEPARADFAKMRAAAAMAQDTAAEIQRLVAGALRQRAAAPAALERPRLGSRENPDGEGPCPPRPHASVLVVDDHPDVRNSLCVMVRTLGYPAHAVSSGEAALAWLANNTASIVFTDFGMPGMDGTAVAKAVSEQQPGVPVVLMTGWGTIGCTPPGVRRVVAKPLRMAQLRECLEALAGDAAR
jgi:CheY-like chemotaxis protein